MEATLRQITPEDTHSLASYLGQNLATTIRLIRVADHWRITKEDGKITGVWSRTYEGTDDEVPCAQMQYCLDKWDCEKNIEDLTKALKNEFNIQPKDYENDPLYKEVDDTMQCDLLHDLYKRLSRCVEVVNASKNDDAFEQYGIPKKIRNVLKLRTDAQPAQASISEKYQGHHDYTIFGEKIGRREYKETDLAAVFLLRNSKKSPPKRIQEAANRLKYNKSYMRENCFAGEIDELYIDEQVATVDSQRNKLLRERAKIDNVPLKYFHWNKKRINPHDWEWALRHYFDIRLGNKEWNSFSDCNGYLPAIKASILRGNLFERTFYCQIELTQTKDPYDSFRKYKIPSRMRVFGICNNNQAYLSSTLCSDAFRDQPNIFSCDELKNYCDEDEKLYTIFGEKLD